MTLELCSLLRRGWLYIDSDIHIVTILYGTNYTVIQSTGVPQEPGRCRPGHEKQDTHLSPSSKQRGVRIGRIAPGLVPGGQRQTWAATIVQQSRGSSNLSRHASCNITSCRERTLRGVSAGRARQISKGAVLVIWKSARAGRHRWKDRWFHRTSLA